MRNPVYFFILIIGFTALILAVLKFGGKRLVYFVMLAAVAVTIYYVMLALEAPFYNFIEGVSVSTYNMMQVLRPYSTLPLVLTLILTLLLYKYPEWYVLDATGLIIGGGAAAIFGISLGIVPVLLLMVILAVYDAIAVYKTKHMVSLAESIVDMRVPILFVLPRKRNFSLLSKPLPGLRGRGAEPHNAKMEEAFFMGLGDAIIPTLLVVSANRMPAFTYYLGLINAPALGALIGTLAGYAVLSRIAGRGTPHAGLPFLNSGAIIGFVIGYMFMP
jgi:presenilin-like A22 family membrane protease